MFFATSAAPTLRASNGDTCLYSVPTVMRSSSREHRAVDRAGDVVVGEFRRGAHVDDFVKLGEL